ncbi:MAG: 3-methylornithyl-N6-L-lysine dehydrogenase PylD [Bacillota bacterium]|nr:3-methylornithyl-N6-L-lysine dehydrogenase PylD [Bacillota bacterium]
MTRLTTGDVADIPAMLPSYDRELVKKTGYSLAGIAASAAVYDLNRKLPGDFSVAVIPVSTGKGKIEGFVEAVQAVIAHLGGKAFITSKSDVKGLAEACRSGATAIMLADDDMFAAINLQSRIVVDNDQAAAAGYAAALDLMTGGLKNKKVLLIGAGRLGSAAAKCLLGRGALLTVLDRNKEAERTLVNNLKKGRGAVAAADRELEELMAAHSLVFEATPDGGYIGAGLIEGNKIIVAPGIPLALDEEANHLMQERLIHDPLQIGVAVMFYMLLS